MKGWKGKEVVDNLGYLNLNNNFPGHAPQKERHYSRHLTFLRWLNRTFSKKVKIMDIGGGSGTLLHTIVSCENSPIQIDKVERYTCYDLNPYCVKNGEETFKEYNNIKFIEQDLDNHPIQEKADVVYVDSTLTMFEKPYDVLYNLFNVSDYVVLNRTTIDDIPRDIKKSFKWDGMLEESVLWNFSIHKMKKFSESYGREMILIKGLTHSKNSAHQNLSPNEYDIQTYRCETPGHFHLLQQAIDYFGGNTGIHIMLKNTKPGTDPWS